MQLRRNEVMTGLLVLGTLAVLTIVLVILGAPGLFRPLVSYKIYFDNAAGIKEGAPVLLAGRKIGQVTRLYSPVSDEEAKRARSRDVGSPVPSPGTSPAEKPPELEVRIDVQVAQDARVYLDAVPRLMTLGLLGETAIDFTSGTESSGPASDGTIFVGRRVPDFGESISGMLEIVKPVAAEASTTLKELQTTAQNLGKITDESSQLNMAIAQFRTFAENLTGMTARDSSLSVALKNAEEVSANLSKITGEDDLQVTLQNFRRSSEQLKGAIDDLSPSLRQTGANVVDLTDTVKRQPWRLIWPSTKSYPDDQAAATAAVSPRLRSSNQTASPRQRDETITVRKSSRSRRTAATPTPSPRQTGGRFSGPR